MGGETIEEVVEEVEEEAIIRNFTVENPRPCPKESIPAIQSFNSFRSTPGKNIPGVVKGVLSWLFVANLQPLLEASRFPKWTCLSKSISQETREQRKNERNIGNGGMSVFKPLPNIWTEQRIKRFRGYSCRKVGGAFSSTSWVVSAFLRNIEELTSDGLSEIHGTNLKKK